MAMFAGPHGSHTSSKASIGRALHIGSGCVASYSRFIFIFHEDEVRGFLPNI